MVIISKNNKKSILRYKSTHFRYALTYIIITLGVLLFLNIYTAKVNQSLFYNNKETTMLEKCSLASSQISQLKVINRGKISETLSVISSIRSYHILVTNGEGVILYDSQSPETEGLTTDTPEILSALAGKDIFHWQLKNGVMISEAAYPIISYGSRIGAVYMMEKDVQQGKILSNLQQNILWISFLLEFLLIAFSMVFTKAFSARVRRIMDSMRIIRSGDYSHKLTLGGNDELTLLGDEFNDLVDKLQTSENKRRQFVSDASHELKTPLASIKLLSDSILQNDMDTETIREFVADIGDEADRLNRMSEKLLTMTHTEVVPETGYEIVYISPTVHRVVKMLTPVAEQNEVEILLNLSEDNPILIMEDDLYQIIFNLVENGIKYNKHQGQLHIKLSRNEDMEVLTVQDTGVGIPTDSIPHIFERFYRVDKARSRQTGGSGLGLAIVKTIIERNNGQIEVKSVQGQGTTFTVYFPIIDTPIDR